MAYTDEEEEFPWHEGEQALHQLLQVPEGLNPTTPFLSPHAGHMVTISPLIALGTLDKNNWPWTTVWGGEPGFSRPVSESVIGINALIDGAFDPVAEALFGKNRENGVVVQEEEGTGKMVGGLGIHLQNRRRIKLYGKMVAGTIGKLSEGDEDKKGEVQLAIKIEQSMGNCPKYLNKKRISPELPKPKLVSDSLPLPQAAIDLIAKADMFFISSSHHLLDMDTNHRGGPPGFVRVESNSAEKGTVLIYPEYSGNRLYQTLGNLQTTPRAGLVVPDFDTGDVLYVTGTTEILAGKDAHKQLPRSNLAVKITLKAARFVEKGLGFKGDLEERSPYNPLVRYLPSERAALGGLDADNDIMSTLTRKEDITPTISRYRFRIAADPGKVNNVKWKAGQHVALSFADELDKGYSHMRDNDPLSLNDDFVRTFTVSSPPSSYSSSSSPSGGDAGPAEGEFEITVRRVGIVTNFLASRKLKGHCCGQPLVVPLRGFGGEFSVKQGDGGERVAFVAGGVGITPLLAQLPGLDLSRLHLLWTLRAEDLMLVKDLYAKYPKLPASTSLFVTGLENKLRKAQKGLWEELRKLCLSATSRRIEEGDVSHEVSANKDIQKWYICTSPGLRKSLLVWLGEREAIYEDFGY
ncbi:unnamed protein product [Calypogeia fissa]